MTNKICPRCAKLFQDRTNWRAGCDRCGNILQHYSDPFGPTVARAERRAADDGWRHGVRHTPKGAWSKAVL